MKLLEDGTALTYWTDEQDHEWDIKISYDYQPEEDAAYGKDGNMEYPGCDSSIQNVQVDRWEFTVESNGNARGWVLFDGATDKEEAAWAVEIHEAINQEFIDGMGEE